VKKQLIKPMKDEYDGQRRMFEERNKQRQTHSLDERTRVAVTFKADFRTLPTLDQPISTIRNQIFEKVAVYGRPIVLVVNLAQIIDQLNTEIVRRNDLIESIKVGAFSHTQIIHMYFGNRDPTDATTPLDTRYPDLLKGIYQCTDDALFFGLELCSELAEHGNKLVAELGKLGRANLPVISKPDFTKAKEEGLMPDYGKYQNWFTGFPKVDNSTAS
jgi:hypothetical protein